MRILRLSLTVVPSLLLIAFLTIALRVSASSALSASSVSSSLSETSRKIRHHPETLSSCRLRCKHGQCHAISASQHSQLDEQYFWCDCDPGYTLAVKPGDARETCQKVEVDFCEKYGRERCGPHGKCVRVARYQFRCVCASGYREEDEDGSRFGSFRCVEAYQNEWRSGKCSADSTTPSKCNNGQCKMVPDLDWIPTRQCVCDKGFKQTPDKQSCVDIDECEEDAFVCGEGVCENLVGKHRCKCNKGYRASVKYLVERCYDVDECKEDPQICGSAGIQCHNIIGHYDCKCLQGFYFDDISCVKMSSSTCSNFVECGVGGACTYVSMSGEAFRNAVKGEDLSRFTCVCKNGYYLHRDPVTKAPVCKYDASKSAQSVCNLNPTLCRNGRCVPDEQDRQAYSCRCHANYIEKKYDFDRKSSYCSPIDRCKVDANICGKNGMCEYSGPGKYRCVCVDGSRIWYDPATNRKECSPSEKGAQNQQKDRSICVRNSELCMNGRCIARPKISLDAYTCKCLAGYVKKQQNGMDYCAKITDIVTKCQQNPQLCPNGKCISNSASYYSCKCFQGYQRTEVNGEETCKKKREERTKCEQNPSLCSNGRCVSDSSTNYFCKCNEGYERSYLNGQETCQKTFKSKTKCDLNANLCENGQCISYSRTSHFCKCNDGYKRAYRNDEEYCEEIKKKKTKCELRPNLCGNVKCFSYAENYHYCKCDEGYTRGYLNNEETCKKIAQLKTKCELNPQLCQNGKCISYSSDVHYCQCNPGYRRDVDSNDEESCTETQKSKCELNPYLCKNGKCISYLSSSHYCECNPGYRRAVNENNEEICKATKQRTKCEIDRYLCENGKCVSYSPDSYYCECDKGFERKRQQDGGEYCKGLNMCDLNPSLCSNGQCVSYSPNNYYCKCNDGYRRAYQNQQEICQAENRRRETLCEQDRSLCENGECISNSQSYYYCRCNQGFTRKQYENGKEYCQYERETAPERRRDICKLNGNVCENGKCIPTSMKTYYCQCYAGFKRTLRSDGTEICREEKRRNTCEMYPKICGDFGECMALSDSTYYCKCGPGYSPMDTRPGQQTCRENKRDEYNICQQNEKLCENGRCIPTTRSYAQLRSTSEAYRCECNNGFMRKTSLNGAQYCQEKPNACDRNPNLCKNGQCLPETSGNYQSYSCQCNSGYENLRTSDGTLRRDYCEKIRNPCEVNPQICERGAYKCIPIGLKKYSCRCKVDYRVSYRSDGAQYCKKIKTVCERNSQVCGRGGRCITDGMIRRRGNENNYDCQCYEGFEKKRYDNGRYYCREKISICNRDEGKDLCGVGGRCQSKGVTNSEDYDCECFPGYQKKLTTNSVRCVKRDEPVKPNMCRKNPRVCGNGRCIWRSSTQDFVCKCYPGSVQVELGSGGKTCKQKNGCLQQAGEDANPCGYGGVCITISPSASSSSSSAMYTCKCKPGFYKALKKGQPYCMAEANMLSCKKNPTICGKGRCVEARPSYKCECDAGFAVKEFDYGLKTCKDIDECVSDANLCSPNGKCVNSRGDYNCVCDQGFEAFYDAKRRQKNCRIKQTNRGMLMCADPRKNRCGPNGYCVPKANSYYCICKNGYENVQDSVDKSIMTCQDIDECKLGAKCANGVCVNTAGSYKCDCNAGFKYNAQYFQCVSSAKTTRTASCEQCHGGCADSSRCKCLLGRTNLMNVVCVDAGEYESFRVLKNWATFGKTDEVEEGITLQEARKFLENQTGSSKSSANVEILRVQWQFKNQDRLMEFLFRWSLARRDVFTGSERVTTRLNQQSNNGELKILLTVTYYRYSAAPAKS